MEQQITSSIAEGRLELVLSGEVTEKNVSRIIGAVISEMQKAGQRKVLIDVRTIKGRLGVGQTYFQVRDLPPEMPRRKTAVVDLEGNRSYFEFHELTSWNVGRHIRFFVDLDEARAWLDADSD